MTSEDDNPPVSRRTIRLGESFEMNAPIMVDGQLRTAIVTPVRRGTIAIPEPYRSIIRYGSISKTPIAACFAVEDQALAPLALLEANGSAIGMVSVDADPDVTEALQRPEMRRAEDLVALVRIFDAPLEGPAASLSVPSAYGFHTVREDGKRIFVGIEDIVSVRIQWDRRIERPIVDLGSNIRAEVSAFGFGEVSEDGGATRTSLDAFIRKRSPTYRRGPGVNQALSRQFMAYRRTESDIEAVKGSLSVEEMMYQGGAVREVEISMSLDDATRQKIYGTPTARARRGKRANMAASTMPLRFDECVSYEKLGPEDLEAIHAPREGDAGKRGTRVNEVCRELAIRTLRKMDTLTLRTYLAIVSECRGDRMEWVEDGSRICEVLGESSQGKMALSILERIRTLKRVELRLSLAGPESVFVRDTPLFQYGGSVAEIAKGVQRRSATVWNLHPSIVRWMNEGGRFSYLDPRSLQLGGIEAEWEARSYFVLCDRWAAGWVSRRRDPERAETIKAGMLLDTACVGWRRPLGYSLAPEDAGRPRRSAEFARRFRSMVDTLIDLRLVQFAEPVSVSEDPAETSWRFVAPVEHRDELERHLSKRLSRAERDDRSIAKRGPKA